jgi:Protein of unknown function DUF262/Protein of unknown function (DUF1524)
MSESLICLKTVYDLRVNASDEPVRYHIPAYQRGYRWTPTQVTQLLDDIREFTKRENPQPEEFYCLQPLVLRPNDDGAYEVVDGQQRLTTLLLILRHFNERLTARFQQKLYRLEYETRPDLHSFLDNPSSERAASNIDFFHIDQAIRTISDWFQKRESEVDTIKGAFLNSAKVIWFQLSSGENAVAAFTRLNVGKIPLTNGELIRALFLKRGKGGSPGPRQLRIALEWDALEKTLQGPDFWSFVSNDTERRGSRIDFIFDLVARQDRVKLGIGEYATFNHFSQKLTGKDSDPEAEWLAVKRTFMLLEEWFADRRLYHLVGYLIWAGEDVNALRDLAGGATKQEFKTKLKAKIFEYAFRVPEPVSLTTEWIADQLDVLDYSPGSPRIRRILLLFNLATLLGSEKSNMRFQFRSFKTDNWDIEHVRSVAPDRPGTPRGKVDWLVRCQGYLNSANEAPDLQTEIQAFIDLPAKEATDAAFDTVYEKVLRHFREDAEHEADNGISNLVLLDSATNRSYGNAVFAVKRQRVLSLDRDGVFVPLCTRNVFLKCYNPQVDHVMFWTQKDRDGYRQVMVDTLHAFFTGGWVHG